MAAAAIGTPAPALASASASAATDGELWEDLRAWTLLARQRPMLTSRVEPVAAATVAALLARHAFTAILEGITSAAAAGRSDQVRCCLRDTQAAAAPRHHRRPIPVCVRSSHRCRRAWRPCGALWTASP